MVVVVVSQAAVEDLDRISAFLVEHWGIDARPTLLRILEALELLAWHPEIGRPLPDGQRELVMMHGKSGYVALYQYDPRRERVVIARIRHQREAGYPAR